MTSALNSISPLIHLVDDDAAVREGLARLLATVGLRTVSWSLPQEFLSGVDRAAVGAVVLDARMPGLSGLAVLEQLKSAGIEQPVIMLTGHGTVDMCRRAFKAGAVEFLEKPVDDQQLIDAVHAAVSQHVRSRAREVAGREVRERFARLSVRESEVLRLMVTGQTSKQIGRSLGLSPRTVETHRSNLSAKLESESLAQLITQYAALIDEQAEP